MNRHSDLPPDVVEALHAGRKIEAIRLLREHTGLGLKEAKEAVEVSGRDYPASAARRGAKTDSGLGRLVIVLALFAGLYIAYRLFR